MFRRSLLLLTLFLASLVATAQKVYMAYLGPYNAGTSYAKNEVVLFGSTYYISLSPLNIGHTPSTSSSQWAVFASQAPSLGTYSDILNILNTDPRATRLDFHPATDNSTVQAPSAGTSASVFDASGDDYNGYQFLWSATGGKLRQYGFFGTPADGQQPRWSAANHRFELVTPATGPSTAAAVVALFNSGTCSGYLKSDGTCSTPSAGSSTQPWSCQPGIGDGTNAITAATYLQSSCFNDTGQTITLTGIKCYSDGGTNTMTVTNGAGTALLTGAVTCSTSFAAGTQSGTTTVAAGDFLKFSFVAGGTAKQASFVVTGTHP